MKKQTKMKRVKAWAVITQDGNFRNVLAFEECSQCGVVSDVLPFFPTKGDAENFRSRYLGDEVKRIEITITYKLNK